MRGAGTILNVSAVLVGGSLGALLGGRLPQRIRDVVTDGLGLVTLLVAAVSIAAVNDPAFRQAVGNGGTVLVVLGAMVVGGCLGAWAQIEMRLESLGGWLRSRFVSSQASSDADHEQRARFINGFVTASLVFCVGPLTILGSLSDGLGRGTEQLALKSTLDGFAALAFASSLGWGVVASAAVVGVVQGTLTIVAVFAGDFLGDAEIAAMTATGGLLIVGISIRLLRIRQIQVADLLPAIVVAPALCAVVAAIRT